MKALFGPISAVASLNDNPMGFYRIIDPGHPWMTVVIYSFPDTGSEVLGSPSVTQKGN